MTQVSLPESGGTMEAMHCPFCTNEELHVTSNGVENHFVVCSTCGSEGPAAETEELAVNKWNTRPAVNVAAPGIIANSEASPLGVTPAHVVEAGLLFVEKFDGKVDNPEVMDLLYRAMRDVDTAPLPASPLLSDAERKQLAAFFYQVVFGDYLPDNPQDLRMGIEGRYLMHRLMQHQLAPSLAEALPDALRYRELVAYAADDTRSDNVRYRVAIEHPTGRLTLVNAGQVSSMLDLARERREQGDASPIQEPKSAEGLSPNEQYKDSYSYFFSYSHMLQNGRGFGFGSLQLYLKAEITDFDDLRLVAEKVKQANPQMDSVNILNFQLLRTPLK